MLAIDRLLHAFHHELTSPTRPAGINLIGGSLSDVLDFLHRLTYGTERSPGASDTGDAGIEKARRDASLARARLGDRLRVLRRAAGLSGRQLGVQTGMSQSRISEIETGRRAASVAEVERLSRALGAAPDEVAALATEASTLPTQRRSSRRLPRQDRTDH
ncbi:MAG: helix-turn-helix domain-containing protein [Chloroflexi bacterium]|nr:helix-turn-helix domain-containing protein [Chloroflexota bacterium]